MAKSSILFLSGLLAMFYCNAQTTQNSAAHCDCNSKAVRDSLTARYLDSGVLKYWYNDPRWDLYCDSLIHICPNIADAYQLKAVPLIKNGDYAIAFPLEDKAVQFDSVTFTSYRGFLKCIFTKDYTGAITDFTKAQQLAPNSYEMDHSFFFYIGLCYLELKNYKLAEKNLKRDVAIETNGDTTQSIHFNTAFYLGVLYYEMKNDALAQKYLLQCLHAYEQHPDANYYLGLVYKREKNTDLATKYLLIAKQSFIDKYKINEGNMYYVYYPHEVTLYETEKALAAMK